MVKKSRGLGKGLSALLPKVEEENQELLMSGVIEIPTDQVRPNPKQPRKEFNESKLKELADSIHEHGIIQPIIVRKIDDHYEIIAGERRWRASQSLNLDKVSVIIKDVDDNKLAELALIENIQREDLNPIDEASAYRRLMTEFELTQDELAKKVGKSRSLIANMVRLLNLSPKLQDMVAHGELSTGHARALLAIDDRTLQVVIAEKVVRNQLSVRQTEEIVKDIINDCPDNEAVTSPKVPLNPIIFQLEDRLRNLFGTKVKIKNSGEKGKIEIEYYNTEDFNRILELVCPNEKF